jgi:RND family efflux transporter MFP subunit
MNEEQIPNRETLQHAPPWDESGAGCNGPKDCGYDSNGSYCSGRGQAKCEIPRQRSDVSAIVSNETFLPCQVLPSAVAALTLLALITLLSGCEKKEAAAPTPPTVEVVKVEQKDVAIYRDIVGTLEGNVNATISAQVTGYLLNRAYTEGSRVTNGQVLFQIDPAPFKAELDKAKSQLSEAQATEEKYALTVQRYTPLAVTEAISKQELDDAVQNQKAAQGQVEAARAAVQQAELNLGFTTIRSPLDGMAGLASAQAQVGNLVGPSSGQLTTVTTDDPMRVYFSVSQRLVTDIMGRMLAEGKSLNAMSEGPPLELTLANGSVYPLKGRIRFRNNQVDIKTGTVRVVGEFPNPKFLLVPGMFVSVRVLLDTEKDALLVPQRAVTEMQGRYLIALVGADNKVSIRPVSTGERVGPDWVISGEVKAGDDVVAEGIQKVRDGAQVKPVPFVENPAAGGSSSPEADKKQ